MNIKFPAGISLSIFLFCTSVFAEQLQVRSVYTDQKDEVSFIITLPEGIKTTPNLPDFQLLDGTGKVLKQQADKIESFKESGRGFDLLFCIDVSGSMHKILPKIKKTLIGLIDKFKSTREEDRFGIVSFANQVKTEVDFTNDRDALEKIIRKLQSKGKQTLLYRAVIDSLNKLGKDMQSRYRRILVISDGKDEGSNQSADNVIDLSKKYGIPIDAIAQSVIPKQYSESLGRLTDATAGQFIPDTTELTDAIIQIYENLMANTWVVYFRYTPDTEKPQLKNAVIKFKQNDSLTLSTTLSKGIPMPKVEEPPVIVEPQTSADGNGRSPTDNKLFVYFGLGLLIISLLFIFWKSRQRKKHPKIAPCADTKPNKKRVEPELKSDIQLPEAPKPRQTEVSASLQVPQKSENQLNLALLVLEGPLKGQKIRIDKQLFRIGADLDNDLVLIDDYISGNHALLRYDNGQLLLSDQHSLNGTLLNGKLVEDKAVPVLPEDIIQIGKSPLKLIEI